MRTFEEYQNGELISSGEYDIDWTTIRKLRDAALEECDWRALKDVVLTNAWKLYRQSLRDLPQDHAESNDAADAFPTPPE